MKIVNYMNFVRKYEPRVSDIVKSEEILFNATKTEIELAKEFKVDSTFLLQYDALIDDKYIELFKREADDTMEIGLWFEVVRQLTDKVGLEWRGEADWTWDWHVVPGFLMSYTQDERKALIDEAMNTFKGIYGYYPKTVASWLIDTYSAQYLSEKYNVSALAICRDQTNTDAYTLIGGYFNQGYYPSKNNMFTPAQSKDNQVNTPVFRLLGPDPIHNYDSDKYTDKKGVCYTLEPGWKTGLEPEIVDWFIKTYYENESLGFAYAQIGQENSFAMAIDFLPALRMQLEKFTAVKDISFMKMADTGEWFKKTYSKTPATAVTALDNWDLDKDIQSVYYDTKRYSVNIFRYENKIFIRNMYLFDDNNTDLYLTDACQTWDATYENLPLVDTLLWEDNDGIVLDTNGSTFKVEKVNNDSLKVLWDDKAVTFSPEGICFKNITPEFNANGSGAKIVSEKSCLEYEYNGILYALNISGGKICTENGVHTFVPDGDEIRITL